MNRFNKYRFKLLLITLLMGVSSLASARTIEMDVNGLVCAFCAQPAVMVALGAGAALAGLVTAVPQLIWLSEHKAAVFGLAFVMLGLSGALLWRARRLPCP